MLEAASEVTKDGMDRIVRIVEEQASEIEYPMPEAGRNCSFRGNNTGTGQSRMTLVDRKKRGRTAPRIEDAIRPEPNVAPGVQVRARIGSGDFGRRGSGGAR